MYKHITNNLPYVYKYITNNLQSIMSTLQTCYRRDENAQYSVFSGNEYIRNNLSSISARKSWTPHCPWTSTLWTFMSRLFQHGNHGHPLVHEQVHYEQCLVHFSTEIMDNLLSMNKYIMNNVSSISARKSRTPSCPWTGTLGTMSNTLQSLVHAHAVNHYHYNCLAPRNLKQEWLLAF